MSKIYILLRLYILLKIPFRKITVTFQIPLDPSPTSLPLGEPYPFPAFALKSCQAGFLYSNDHTVLLSAYML